MESGATLVLVAPMIRIQIRCPPPPSAPIERSGPLVLDIHDLRVVTGDGGQRGSTTRFGSYDAPTTTRRSSRKKLLSQVEWSKLVVSLAGAAEPRASAIVSIAPLPPSPDKPEQQQPDIKPIVFVRQSDPPKADEAPSTSIEVRLPYAAVNLDKSNIDSLQLWADDCTQWAERTFGDGQRSARSSAETSMIGSRYFAHTPKGMGSLATIKTAGSSEPSKKAGEFVVSVAVEQGKNSQFNCQVHLRLTCSTARESFGSAPRSSWASRRHNGCKALLDLSFGCQRLVRAQARGEGQYIQSVPFLY